MDDSQNPIPTPSATPDGGDAPSEPTMPPASDPGTDMPQAPTEPAAPADPGAGDAGAGDGSMPEPPAPAV